MKEKIWQQHLAWMSVVGQQLEENERDRRKAANSRAATGKKS